MSALKLTGYFLSHPAAFGLQASTLPGNTAFNPANVKTDLSPLNFHTAIRAAAHVTLGREQHITHMKAAIVDASFCLEDSER